ncbi:hypothetical protein BTVI_45916 [Pitangus sulphuratus]|nr:hypothetical protein BTVI_45916 [Pitangus sulphuratus]
MPDPELAPGRTCGELLEREVYTGTGLLAGLVTCRGPTLEQFLKSCSLTLENFVEHCLLWVEQQKSVRSPSPEEGGVAELVCDELTAVLIAHILEGRRQRNQK